MKKKYGSMTSDELMDIVNKAVDEMSTDQQKGEAFLMIPKNTLVAIVQELKDCFARKFFFELGRSLQLKESFEQALKNVPEQYVEDFIDGAGELEKLKNCESAKCNSCQYKITAVNTMQGKVYIASSSNQG